MGLNIFEKIILAGIIILAIFTPLAFGTVQVWSITVSMCFVFLLFTLWLTGFLKGNLSLKNTFLYLPLVFFVIYVFIQIFPLPGLILKFLSSKAFFLHERIDSFCDIKHFSYLSVNLFNTISEISSFLTFFLIFFVTFNTVKNTSNIKTILSFIVIVGFFISVVAIVQKFSWTGKIYWLVEIPEKYGVFGPFLNYDNYGGYMNMIFFITLGLLLSEKNFSKIILISFMSVIIAVSVLISRSRGAVLTLLLTLIITIVILFIQKKYYGEKNFYRIIISLISICIFIILFIYWVDWGLFIGRIKTIGLEENFLNPRLSIWKESIGAVKDFFITGAGYGCYQDIFPSYQKSYIHLFWRYAHNDYLQLFIETGIIGFLLISVFAISFFYFICKLYSKIHSPEKLSLLTGITAGIISIMIHSSVDFNLHIFSNYCLFAILLGLTSGFYEEYFKKINFAELLSKNRALTIIKTSMIFIFIIFFVIVLPVKKYFAYRFYNHSEQLKSQPYTSDKTILELQKKAIKLSPLNPQYHHSLGKYYQELAAIETKKERKIELLNNAKKEIETALKISPANGRYWLSYGWLMGNFRKKDKAIEAFKITLELEPERPQILNIIENSDRHLFLD